MLTVFNAASVNNKADAVAPVVILSAVNTALLSVIVTGATDVFDVLKPLTFRANVVDVGLVSVKPTEVITPFNVRLLKAPDAITTAAALVTDTFVIVEAVLELVAFASFTVTEPATVPATVVVAVARAVWLTVTDVVFAVPVTVVAPNVFVVLTTLPEFSVIVLTVPPLTFTAPPDIPPVDNKVSDTLIGPAPIAVV